MIDVHVLVHLIIKVYFPGDLAAIFKMNYSKKFHRYKILLVFTIYSMRTSYSTSIPRHKVYPCTDEVCELASKFILSNMNTEADPCEDFYEFVCGKFVQDAKIPGIETITSNLRLFTDKYEEQVREVIVEKPESGAQNKPYQLLRAYYEACTTYDDEGKGIRSLKEVLKQLGGWPIITKDWDENSFKWPNTLYQFRETGFGTDYLLKFSIEEDLEYKVNKTINIDQVTFELDRTVLIQGEENEMVNSYYRYMIAVAVILGAAEGKSHAELNDQLKEMLHFEIALANITEPEEKRQNFSYLLNPYSIGSLERQFSSIPWKEYIVKIVSPVNISLISGDIINIKSPDYISNLDSLLKNTKKRTIANYLFWRAISSSAMYLGKDIIARRKEFESVIGTLKIKSMWSRCIRQITDKYPFYDKIHQLHKMSDDVSCSSYNLGHVVSYYYARRYFPYQEKNDVRDYVNRIRSAAVKVVEKADWIVESKTRTTALNKLRNMTTMIGYDDDLDDIFSALEYYYEKLEINSKEFFLSYLNLSKFDSHLDIRYLLHGATNLEMRKKFNSAAFCGGYDMEQNKMLLAAGMLQHPIYARRRPAYLNFGQLGVIIGHEITHAIDNTGSHFDDTGKRSEWWDSGTRDKFSEKKRCLIRQYSDFLIKELNVRTKEVGAVAENVADNGGLTLAYNAYKEWLKKYLEDYEDEQTLPDLQKYTGQQMFWISAAMMHCTKYSFPERLILDIHSEEHSVGQFRAVGAFRNNENFARDFKCDSDSKMNPSNRCKLW